MAVSTRETWCYDCHFLERLQKQERGGLRAVGRYQLLRPLAVGGMGQVFLASFSSMQGVQKLFAIKVLLPHIAHQQEIVDMFINEARVASKMSHPNICQVFELGLEGDELFIAMEYLKGIPLTSILRGCSPDHPMPPRHALGVIEQATRGLHYAHQLVDERGQSLELVHRDISPGNLFLTDDGVAKILDFGVVKATTNAQQTRTGLLKGKFCYMSPEQIKGEPLDRRADVFSLGVCLYELLTNRPLFSHKSEYEAIQQITERPIRPLRKTSPELPAAVEDVVMKALAQDRDERFATMSEFGAALQEIAIHVDGLSTAANLADFVREKFGKDLAQQQTLAEEAKTASQGVSFQDTMAQTELEGRASTGHIRTDSPADAPLANVNVHRQDDVGSRDRRLLPTLLAILGLAGAGLAAGLWVKTQGNSKAEATPSIVRYEGTLAPAAQTPTRQATAVDAVAAVDAGISRDARALDSAAAVDESAKASSTRRKKSLPCADREGPEERNPCLLEGRTRALGACLTKHAPSEQDGSSLRFRLSKSGKVKSVELTPRQLQTTPLHSCVANVIERIDFGRQKGQVQMVVPLHWE